MDVSIIAVDSLHHDAEDIRRIVPGPEREYIALGAGP